MRQGFCARGSRSILTALASAAVTLVVAPSALAASPSLGPLSATDIQGVSALLVGSVDPKGLATSYRFDYVDQAGFEASGFAGAAVTATAFAGPGGGVIPARAAVSGLTPDTSYRYRLVAGNSSETATSGAASFTTTHGFGFLPGAEGLGVGVFADGGEAATQIGSHPYQLSIGIGLDHGGEFEGQPGVAFPDGDLRDLRIGMPPGLIANPAALHRCTPAQFHTPRSSPFEESRAGESCSDDSQLGTVEVETSRGGGELRRFGLFNLEPAPGVPAQIGFAPYGSPIVLDAELAPDADGAYALDLRVDDFPQSLSVYGLRLALWGTPWAASHNGERGDCLHEAEPEFPWAKCSVGEPLNEVPQAYLTLPSACSQPFAFTVSADSWQQPATVSRSSAGQAPPLGDCAGLPFGPQPVGELTTTRASSSSGFAFVLDNENAALLEPGARSPSQARTALVTLAEGVTINPSVGAGLGACTPAQYAAERAFSPQGAACPSDSKIGSFSVRTPLFDELLKGAIYLAEPDDPIAPGAENPFDTMIAVYLVAKLPQRGVMVKLPGKIVLDPVTGRLTATLEGLPQLPYTDLQLNFRAGQRTLLVSPPSCGAAATRIELSPWAGTASSVTTSTTQIASGIGGGPCPTGTPSFAPGAVAGGVNSNVNSYTPYFVHLSRSDSEQEITSFSLVLPRGITAKLAGVPFCPDAAVDRARGRSGRAETADPSCPQASLVGHTLSGYGVGPALSYAAGEVYLAGPYHGAPLSLVTIDAATVGPFDLGTVVVRSAFQIDPLTAQVRIDSRASDPIPHILDGVPLHLRDVRVYVDRPGFTHNPSSCAPSQLESTVGGSGARFADPADDGAATVTVPFQLLNCRTLGFKPKLGLRLRGGTRRGSYPELRATFAARGPQDSNLKEIAVTIPHQMFLAQEHIRGICTVPEFEAGRCPPDSVYGSAVAYTPLFDQPLRGNVYLRSAPGRRLPDLVASLYSGSIHIVLEGRIGPGREGGIRALFRDLPDEPLERFVMTLFGGRRGLLVNSADICAAPPVSSVKALAQNNLGTVFATRLRGRCGGKHQQSRHGKLKGGSHGETGKGGAR